MPKKPARRPWGTGSVTWRTPTTAVLRVRQGTRVRSKTVRTARRDQGGRGEAAAELATFRDELEAEANAQDHPTLAAAFDEYISDLKRLGKRGGTVESYGQVKARLSEELASTPIDRIGPRDLEVFYGSLSDRYADGTIATTHQVVKAVLNACIRWGWLTTANPAAAVKLAERGRKFRKTPTPADVLQLILSAEAPKERGGKNNIVLAAAITLASFTGARRGELVGLRWSDVDWDDGIILVCRQWSVGPGGQLAVQDLKSSTGTDDEGRRWIWSPGAVAALANYRDYQRDLLGRGPEGWLLSYDGGTTPIRPGTLGDAITKHCRDMGYDGLTPHAFRRLAASESLAGGADVAAAAQRLGHTTKMMLDRYVTARKDKAIAAGTALEARLAAQGLPVGELLRGEP